MSKRELVITKRGRGPLNWGLSFAPREPERQDPIIPFDQWAEMLSSFSYNGVRYTAPGAMQEEIGVNFSGLAAGGFKGNAVVYACMAVRMRTFSQGRFQFRRVKNGRPGDFFGTQALDPLENPGRNQNTNDLLARMILNADLSGNWFGTNRYRGITSLRPDWVTIIIESSAKDEEDAAWDPDATVAGYMYKPGGAGSGRDPVFFFPEEVAHFAPTPDPEARFRGMSWLTPVVREVMADKAFTDHRLKFVENGATPNMLVKFPVEDVEKFRTWIEMFREQHEGTRNAAKTLFLGAGMDATPVGVNMKDLDFTSVQGAGESRIAAAAETPPILIGLSEGLESATYSNYGLAKRRFGDMTMRPLWENAAGALAPLVKVPENAELCIDPRDIAFLQEDQRDAAEIQQRKATTIATLIINGFDPDSAVKAVTAGDLSTLEHTGLVSVQLQEPGAGTEDLPTLPEPRSRVDVDDIEDAVRSFANGRN